MAKPSTKKTDPLAALESHASNRKRLKFTEEHKHGRHRFYSGMVVEFEDPRIAAYFDIAFNGTEFTTAKPNVVIGADEIEVDELPGVVIGIGRENVAAGTTVAGVITGEGPIGTPELAPANVTADSQG